MGIAVWHRPAKQLQTAKSWFQTATRTEPRQCTSLTCSVSLVCSPARSSRLVWRALKLHSRCGGNSAALNQVMHKILLRFDPSLDLKAENVSQAYQLGQLQQDSDTEHLDLDE